MDRVAIRVVKAVQGISTGDLARRAGVDRATAWRWETGRPNVSQAMARRLQDALLEGNRAQAAPAEKTAT